MLKLYFSIEKFTYINQADKIDLSFVSPLFRRKLNNYDKKIIYLLNSNYDTNIQEIYLSSRYGEVERLKRMMEEYKEYKEVSPNAFSSSVHNFPVGFFSILKKISIPTYSLSASDDSFQNAFLAALCSKNKRILFCHEENSEFLSFVIDKNNPNLVLQKSNKIYDSLSISSFKKFNLNNQNELMFNYYRIGANIC